MYIAICGKNEEELATLEKLIVKALFNEDELSIDMYDVDTEFLKAIEDESLNYDIIFLGVELEKLNGFDIAGEIRERNNKCEIVFIAKTDDGVFRAFDYKAFDYLVKPVSDSKMNGLLERYNYYFNSDLEEFFTFKAGSSTQKIKLSSICYFYSNGRKIIIKSENSEYEFYSKLDEVEKIVDDKAFIRIHQSYLVNAAYIRYIINGEIVLDNNEYLPVSRNRQKTAKEKYMEYIQ